MSVIHVENTVEQALPGRNLRWYIGKAGVVNSEHCACNVVKLAPGSTVKPAHSHTSCEEMIYIVYGKGEMYIDGVIHPLKEDTVILLEKNSVHMLRNSGETELKAICFFAPPTTLEEYTFHPDVEFCADSEKKDAQ